MAKGSKRNQERKAAQANKARRVAARSAAPSPKSSNTSKSSNKSKSSSKPKSRPSGNNPGKSTAEIKEKRIRKGIGKYANTDNKGKGGKGASTVKVDKSKLPNALDSLSDNKLDNKVYSELLGKGKPLTEKINAYRNTYDGSSNASKNYLKELTDNALRRMTIRPESYGRSKEGTPYESLSMAEQYDQDSNKLISRLETPLSNYIDSPGDTKGLNMFDSNKELKFDSAKLKKFASSDVAASLRSKAAGLGVSNSAANRTSKTLEGIGKVKNKKSADLKSKFAQDLKFIV